MSLGEIKINGNVINCYGLKDYPYNVKRIVERIRNILIVIIKEEAYEVYPKAYIFFLCNSNNNYQNGAALGQLNKIKNK